ncbi:MAG: hypothetical protein K0B15_17020 [Lentimicrobium sp.]|nr:hypothetical protein [Lentimicrobium sp.]
MNNRRRAGTFQSFNRNGACLVRVGNDEDHYKLSEYQLELLLRSNLRSELQIPHSNARLALSGICNSASYSLEFVTQDSYYGC